MQSLINLLHFLRLLTGVRNRMIKTPFTSMSGSNLHIKTTFLEALYVTVTVVLREGRGRREVKGIAAF